MSADSESPKAVPPVQLAAGGIVWQTIDTVRKLVVIHRPRYDDWSLPKGKPEAGETLAETARREVREELGFDVRFLDFAGTTHHQLADGTVKLVLFWNMAPAGEVRFVSNPEVDELQWLTPTEAVEKLSYATEKELVRLRQ